MGRLGNFDFRENSFDLDFFDDFLYVFEVKEFEFDVKK